MLILAFIATTVTPIAVMTIWLNSGIQRGVMKEAHDKNQLLSENLANPIYLYLKAAQRNLNLLAILLKKERGSFCHKRNDCFAVLLRKNIAGFTGWNAPEY